MSMVQSGTLVAGLISGAPSRPGLAALLLLVSGVVTGRWPSLWPRRPWLGGRLGPCAEGKLFTFSCRWQP